MSTQLLIDGSHKDQVQVALVEDQKIRDFEFESKSKKHLKGNIYLGKVTKLKRPLYRPLLLILDLKKMAF